ncbi:hypothetical protein [Actinacidiphila glaucinigra]
MVVAYRFTLARIVRAGPVTATRSWTNGPTGRSPFPCPRSALSQISGLARQELAGAVFEVMANCAAATDADVDPHGWRLLARSDGEHRLTVPRSWSSVTT